MLDLYTENVKILRASELCDSEERFSQLQIMARLKVCFFQRGQCFAETGSVESTIRPTKSDHTIRRPIHQTQFPMR